MARITYINSRAVETTQLVKATPLTFRNRIFYTDEKTTEGNRVIKDGLKTRKTKKTGELTREVTQE